MEISLEVEPPQPSLKVALALAHTRITVLWETLSQRHLAEPCQTHQTHRN